MIKIIVVGKVKEKFYREAIMEYQKRLGKYTKMDIIEVNDVNDNSDKVILLKEKEEILRYIGKSDYVVALALDGKELNSNEFAVKLDNLFITNSVITFIIGGSYGLHEDIKALARERISFSRLTFPHQLFRIILLEQIYRAFKINNNECYHK